MAWRVLIIVLSGTVAVSLDFSNGTNFGHLRGAVVFGRDSQFRSKHSGVCDFRSGC